MSQTTRRDFLKNFGQAALAAGGALTLESLLSGCAHISSEEEAPPVCPPLKGNKVQPPENGCMVGFYYPAFVSKRILELYEERLGKLPSIFIFYWGRQTFVYFPMVSFVEAARKGVTPFMYVQTMSSLDEIAKGKHDQQIGRFAEEAIKYGEEYGGFFINTMWEMNIEAKYRVWPWAGQPGPFKKAWQHIWQVFEDKGANQYATWVIEYHVDHPLGYYYPGDKYVDWIGLSAYNRAVHRQYFGYRYLNELISGPHKYFASRYKDKPIMLAEFGSTNGKDQPKWLIKAYDTIKSRWKIKAANYWDSIYAELFRDDHTLSQESLNTLKEIFKDPYWIMAK